MTSWASIPSQEEDAIWKRFYSRYDFRPSVSAFPAINEPTHSLTFSISAAFASPVDAEQLTHDLDDAALRVFSSLVGSNGRIIALDWQHECYYFKPLLFDGGWAIPTFPNGDYCIFLSEDMNDGWFGHPWEETICVFGQRAIANLESKRPRLFSSPIRRNGRSII